MQTRYMDYNATSPLRETAKAAMRDALEIAGNPSSVHAEGRKAKSLMDRARARVAGLVGGRARDVVFTGGGTEANNSILRQSWIKRSIISAVEHDCSFAAVKTRDFKTDICPVDHNGVIDLKALDTLIAEDTEGLLVSVMAANNETGILQPVQEIADMVRQKGGRFHSDAAQLLGRIPFNMAELKADYVTVAAHKFGGPKGVGAIVLGPTTPLDAFIVGGGQELGRRSGTENIVGIAGLGAAAEDALLNIGDSKRLAELRDEMEARLLALGNDIYVAGKTVARLPNTSCIAMPGVKGETQVMHLDLAGICVSSGSACSSGKVKVSHVLKAMGQENIADQTIRISLGPHTNADDIEALVDAWTNLYQRTRKGA